MDTLGDDYILIPQDFGMIPFSCLRSRTLYKEKTPTIP
jgi:hypothetical protein